MQKENNTCKLFGSKSLGVFICRSNRAEVFSVVISSAKNKDKKYKKKTSTKTIYFFAEIIPSFLQEKKTRTEKHVADWFCRISLGSIFCKPFLGRFFSRFCRNKNEIQQFFDFFSLTTWFI
jgi:hypothetical protein